MPAPIRSALVAVLLLGLAAQARAGGFEHPDNGTVPLGRGGAFTARASDGTAFHYNPAGLAGQRGHRLMLLANFTDLHYCFTRSGAYPSDYDVPTDTPYSAAGPMCDFHGLFEGMGPMITFSTDLGLRRGPVFGIGLWGPSSMLVTGYSQDGEDVDNPAIVRFDYNDRERVTWAPNRFDLVDNRLEVIYISPTVAYEVIPGLRLGATFQWIFSKFEFTNYGALDRNDPAGRSARNHLVVSDVFTPGVQLAVQYQLGRHVQMGALFRYVAAFDADGDLEVDAVRLSDDPDRPGQEEIGTDTVPAELDVANASSLRLGARFLWPRDRDPRSVGPDDRPWDPMVDEVFDVELDYVFEAQSAIEIFQVRSDEPIELEDENGDPILLSDPVGDLRIPHAYKDTHSFRLGGDWNALPGLLAGRLGLTFETPTSPVEYTLLDFAPFQRFSVHAGATVRLGPVDLSVAYAHVFQPDRTVEAGEGQGRIAGPGGLCDPDSFDDPEDADACRINEGRYTSSFDIVSIGAQGRF